MKYTEKYHGITGDMTLESFDDDLIYEDDQLIKNALPVEDCEKFAFTFFGEGLSDQQILKHYALKGKLEICRNYIISIVHTLREIGGLWMGDYALLEGEGMVITYGSAHPELRQRWLEEHKDDQFE